ncbi:MAG: sulfotransferase [Myxococcota bacterium]|jgi:hypothetical protein
MGLDIIGAGFGRTGTLSLKIALETLGCGPCYHMLEVAKDPSHARIWSDAADRRPTDWNVLFDGWGAAVDWPTSYFWRELADHFPDAKLLLSVRDADRWYDSMMATIYQAMRRGMPEGAPEVFVRQGEMAKKIVIDLTFAGRLEDRAHAIETYERHNQAVRDAFAGGDRLLEFEPSQGWAPLCEFLGKAVPDEDFPRVNDSASFQERFGLAVETQQS